jgi:uncharacterized repeat protein (TIGR03803 family)
MQSNARANASGFGLSSRPAGVSVALLAALFFLIFLLLGMTFTAPPAYGQSAPATARQAAAMQQYAAKLGHAAQTSSRVARPAEPRASFKNPADSRRRNRRGGPLAGNDLYDNGPINGTTDAWTINSGFVTSDTFTIPSGGYAFTGLSFGAWVFPGDVLQSVEISITSSEFGGTTYFDQVVNFTQSGCSGNQYGFNVCTATSSNMSGPNLAAGTYWVNLQNAVVNTGDPIYWDENSGIGCGGQGCPSEASENSVGTIPSEAFTILGATTTTTTCYDSQPKTVHNSDNLEVIYTFTSEQGSPANGLAIDSHENLFGATVAGGSNSDGLAYELSPSGQNWAFNPLYNFVGGLSGQNPAPEIIGPDHTLYGTASGGLQTCGSSGNEYCGVVYRLRPPPVACLTALCSWGQEVLYQFTGDPDGWEPNGQLAFDQSGNLYGTTAKGGVYGQGTVFQLTPSNGGWTETIIYSFTGGSDGGQPNSLLPGLDGNLYGATYAGGGGGGVIFQLAPANGGWAQTVISSFDGCAFTGNGGECNPVLVQEQSGSFYGMYDYSTQLYRDGSYIWYVLSRVFVMSPASPGRWQFGTVGDTYYQYCAGYPWCYAAGSAIFIDAAVSSAGFVYATSVTDEGCFGSYGELNQLVPYDPNPLADGEFPDVQVGPSGNLYGTLGAYDDYPGMVWEFTPP